MTDPGLDPSICPDPSCSSLSGTTRARAWGRAGVWLGDRVKGGESSAIWAEAPGGLVGQSPALACAGPLPGGGRADEGEVQPCPGEGPTVWPEGVFMKEGVCGH